MESDPQLFSWPGSSRVAGNATPHPGQNTIDPAQAAADAATAGHQQGFDRGYAEGLAKGEQEALAQVQQNFASMDLIFQEAEAFATQWRAAQIELVQMIAAKFLLQELLADSDRLDLLLRQGQQLLPTSADFSLACHPDIEEALGKQSRYTLVIDPQLPSGAVELRQGSSCLQMDMEALVAQAFASLDQVAVQVPDTTADSETLLEPTLEQNSEPSPDLISDKDTVPSSSGAQEPLASEPEL